MNRACANILRPGTGKIGFYPGLGYEFMIDATHIQMPVKWQTTLDADEIATTRFPSTKTGPTVPARKPTAPMDAVIQNLIGLSKQSIAAQSLLSTTLNPTAFGVTSAAAINTAVNHTTIGTQVGLSIEYAITNTLIPVLQAGIPTQAMHVPWPGSTGGVVGVTKHGSPSNPRIYLQFH
jgi:hypothetical protein